jgi:hypothetical protein
MPSIPRFCCLCFCIVFALNHSQRPHQRPPAWLASSASASHLLPETLPTSRPQHSSAFHQRPYLHRRRLIKAGSPHPRGG